MDKQKQIEEMATETARIVLSCPLNQGRNCGCCKFNDKDTISYDCQSYLVAEELYNAGYRKIHEGTVVLTKEEYESVKYSVDLLREYESVSNSLIKSNELCRKLVEDKKELKRQLKQARNETVDKFAEKLKADGQCGYSMGIKIYTIEEKGIDEIAKEITEGK